MKLKLRDKCLVCGRSGPTPDGGGEELKKPMFDDGGPAFPAQQQFIAGRGEWNQTFESGMTLWDYFAAHAPIANLGGPEKVERLAADAAQYSDAMIAERRKRMR